MKNLLSISKNIRKFWLYQTAIIILALLLTVTVLIEPMFFKILIDRVIPSGSVHYLILFVLAFMGVFILRQFLDFLTYYTQVVFESRIYTDIQESILKKAFSLPYSKFVNLKKGDLMGILNDDIHIIENFLSNSLMLAVRRIFYFVISAAFLLYLNWKLTLVVLPFSLFVPILLKAFNRKVKLQSRIFRKSMGRILSIINDFVNHLREVLSMRLDRWFLELHRKASEDYRKSNAKLYEFQSRGGVFAELMIRGIEVILVLGLGGYMVMEKIWTLGSLVAYLTYINMLQPQIVGLFNLGLSLNKISSSVDKIYQFLSEKEKRTSRRVSKVDDKIIQVRNVTLKAGDKVILDNVTFEVERGEKILIKGQTGAGKSSLILLILGTYLPAAGNVRLFGVEPGEMDNNEFMEKVGYVPQNVPLFSVSIKDNILIGRDYDDELWNRAIRISRVSEFIDKLSKGALSIVGEDNVNLSGGEIQRIGIARAIYSKPKLLIMDEPVSHLDEKTGRKVLDEIFRSVETLVISSHTPLENRYRWDRIYFVENGRVVKAT